MKKVREMDFPFIHLFSIGTDKYLFDVNTDRILQIPEDVYLFLSDSLSENDLQNEEVKIYVEKLKSKGFLKTTRIRKTEHPETAYLESHLKSRVTSMILQVTQNCNLRCEYCVYSGSYYNRVHTNKRMPWDLAKKGIDFLERYSADCERVYLSFYGGEPLLEFDMIKKCILYANERLRGKQIFYNLTTNGTLINEEIVSFFQEQDLHIMISLDGPEEIHDLHRKYIDGKGSYETLFQNLKMIKEKFPKYYNENISFNTVLDPQNGYDHISDYIVKNEILNQEMFTSGIINTTNRKEELGFSETFLVEKNYEHFLMLMDEIGKIDIEGRSPLSKMDSYEIDDIKYNRRFYDFTELPEKSHHAGPCIPGSFRLLLSVDGDFYPCERVCEDTDFMIIGDIDRGLDLPKIHKLLNIEEYNKDECHVCWAYNYCHTCVAETELTDGMPQQSIESCNRTRKRVEELFKDYCVLKKYGA